MRKTTNFYFILLLTAFLLFSCDKEKNGKSLGIPAIRPPVDAATPPGLGRVTAGGLNLTNCGNESGPLIERIRARVFCPGPGDFRYRLGMIDSEMASLNKRAEESERACTKDAAKAWDPVLPGGESFTMHFSCNEPRGQLRVLFGSKDGYHYIAELQNPGGDNFGSSSTPDMAVLAKVDNSGDKVELWQIIGAAEGINYMKLSADRSQKTLEALFVGESKGYGVGCGVNLRSNDSMFTVDGIVNDHEFVGSCSGFQDPQANSISLKLEKACFSNDSLAPKDESECQGAGLNSFKFEQYKYEDAKEWGVAGIGRDLIKGVGIPADLTDFNK